MTPGEKDHRNGTTMYKTILLIFQLANVVGHEWHTGRSREHQYHRFD